MRAPDPTQRFVDGVLNTAAGLVPRVGSRLTAADRLGAVRVRCGIGRDSYRVDPGVYAIGEPDTDSPVLVTANYKLTFDVLRSSLPETSAWLLVLDTRGINVWCAAGKHTFSTEELVARLDFSRLKSLVAHRRVIVPQLGASGVAAHEVRRCTGFGVRYGPVRAADIPAFLSGGMRATPEMRAVTFTLRERLVLTPVELVGTWKPTLAVLGAAVALALAFTRPLTPTALATNVARTFGPYAIAVVGGAVVTPLLLGWLPWRAFSAKGAAVGGALGVTTAAALGMSPVSAAAAVLAMTAISSYVAMNFTGSTPFTSMSGVEREMRRWLPMQAGALGVGVLLTVVRAVLR